MNDWRDEPLRIAEHGTAPNGTAVWFITGGSSGFGLATAKAALAAGFRVAATARSVASLDALGDSADLLKVAMDLHDPASIVDAVDAAEQRFGRIDVLFNNAGTATIGAIEEVGDALLRDQLETNLFGPLAVVRAVLPGMRARRDGHLLQMSSMGGRAAFPGLGAYHASKFALEGASIALAQEVAPHGIRLTLIEPGDFRTPVLAANRTTAAPATPAYADSVGRMREAIAQLDGSQPGDPDKAAAAIIAVTEVAEPPLQLALGPDCYHRLHEQLEGQIAALEKWSSLSLGTDLDPVDADAAS